MIDIDALVDLLQRDEGFRDLVYDDASGEALKPGMTLVGWPTIGYGWNLATDPMRPQEALEHLRARAIVAVKDAISLVPNWDEHDNIRQGVIANMAYNLGHARLAGFHNMLAAFVGKRYAEAANEGLSSKWAAQVGKRAQRLMTELRTGVALT